MNLPSFWAAWPELDLWSKTDDLDALSMVVRALLVFLATLLFLRLAGRRSFGQGSAFDSCLMVLLGAILSRAVVGASAMAPTLCAGATIVVLHRLLAMLLIRWPALDDLVSGRRRVLVEEGRVNADEMRAGLISRAELDTALRKKGDGLEVADIAQAVLERNGDITLQSRRP